MKMLVGIAGGWIGFVLADKALFDERLVPAIPRLAKAIVAGLASRNAACELQKRL